MGPNAHLIDLLLELQTLDRMPRTGYLLRGIADPESISEHTFHTVFLAWVLAASEPKLDTNRVLELALVHDLAEVRLGDLPRVASKYLPAGAKRAAELAVAEELLAPIGPRAPDLLAEYQAAATPEARFVSACDKLQLLIKATVYERWGSRTMDQFWGNLASFEDGGFASIGRLVQELKQRRAASRKSQEGEA